MTGAAIAQFSTLMALVPSRLGTGRNLQNLQAVLVSSDLNLSVAAEKVSKPQFQCRPVIGFSPAFRLLGQ